MNEESLGLKWVQGRLSKAAHVEVLGRRVLLARATALYWEVFTDMGEVVQRGPASSEQDAIEQAEQAIEEILLAGLASFGRQPDRLTAWCAILLRDELVLRGATDVVASLGRPTLRVIFTLHAAQLAAPAAASSRSSQFDEMAHDDLTVLIGASRIRAAADAVVSAHRIEFQIDAVGIQSRLRESEPWSSDTLSKSEEPPTNS